MDTIRGALEFLDLQPKLVVLSEQGRGIKIKLLGPPTPDHAAPVRVKILASAKVMRKHCPVANQMFGRGQRTEFEVIEAEDVVGHELFLRAIHERVDVEEVVDGDMWTLGAEDIHAAVRAATFWGSSPHKLKYFVSLWIGAKDLSTLNAQQITDRVEVCNMGGFDMQRICLDAIMGKHSLPDVIARFPPTLSRTSKQGEDIIYGVTVYKWNYGTLGFSPAFEEVYGLPMYFWKDFFLLMTTSIPSTIVPKYQVSFSEFVEARAIKHFTTSIQNTTRKQGLPVVTRRQVEAAWTQYCVSTYETEFIGDDLITTSELGQAQAALKRAIGNRLTNQKVLGGYWNKMAERHGLSDTDIVAIEEGFAERKKDNEHTVVEDSEESGDSEDEDEEMS